MTDRVRLSISLDDAHVGRLPEVSAAARRLGLTVEQELPTVGVLTGSIARSRVGDIARLDGVQAVEEERTVGIAPPGSPVQ